MKQERVLTLERMSLQGLQKICLANLSAVVAKQLLHLNANFIPI